MEYHTELIVRARDENIKDKSEPTEKTDVNFWFPVGPDRTPVVFGTLPWLLSFAVLFSDYGYLEPGHDLFFKD